MPSDDRSSEPILASEEWDAREQIRVTPDWLQCDAGEIIDMSVGGAMLRAQERLKGNLAVRVYNDDEGIILQARVLWSNPIGYQNHECGLQWCSMGEENRATLEQLLFPFGVPAAAEASDSVRPGLKLIDDSGAEIVPAPEQDEALSIDDPALRELVDAWPHLPSMLRDTMLAMVHGNRRINESRQA